MEVPVFVAPGNHDPYRDLSPWVREPWPENVYIFKRQEISSYAIRELDCRVYGAAFTESRCPGLLEGFRAECTERHALLLLHADPVNSDSTYCPVTAAQLRDSGVDYAALGHIHAPGRFEAGAGLCAWPGCPMGRGFDETNTRGVLIIELEETADVRSAALDVPRFFSYTLDVSGDPAESVESLLIPCTDRDHIRIRITGECHTRDMDLLRAKYREMPNLTLGTTPCPRGTSGNPPTRTA